MIQIVLLLLSCTFLPLSVQAFEASRGSVNSPNIINEDCQLSGFQTSLRKNYIWYNMLDELSKGVAPVGSIGFREKLQEAMDVVKKNCNVESLYFEQRRYTNIKITGNTVLFGLVAGNFSRSGKHSIEEFHKIEYIKRGNATYLRYGKTYGERANLDIAVIKRESGKRSYFKIIDRTARDQGTRIGTYWYEGTDKLELLLSEGAIEDNAQDILPLQVIYGQSTLGFTGALKVGVIGTGLDYNQPGLAKFLAERPAIEGKAIKRFNIKQKLKTYLYENINDYRVDLIKYRMSAFGFPIWMDQALNSHKPYDQLIYGDEIVPGIDHETKVTSRVVEGLEDIEIHFVRRGMGQANPLAVDSIVKEFYDRGVRVVNMSFGGACGLRKAEEAAWDRVFKSYSDMVFVVSAGNSGYDTADKPFCPGGYSTKYKNVISVTALNDEGMLASYRVLADKETRRYEMRPVNYGLQVDVAVKADNLLVFQPASDSLTQVLNKNGASSLAAAEVTNIILKSMSKGMILSAQTIKSELKKATVFDPRLQGVVSNASFLTEETFLYSQGFK